MGKRDEAEEDRLVRRLFKRARKSKEMVKVGKIYVDIPGAIERRVACSDGICMHDRRGRQLTGKTCCTTFRVPIELEEVETIARIVRKVSKIRDVGKAIERADGWWKIEDDEPFLETRPSGACVFLSAPKGDRPWCTIHEWATKHGKDFRDYKPETCCLFPLYTIESEDDEVIVTSYGTEWWHDSEPEEEVDEIQNFDCLSPPAGQGRSVLVEQEDELRYRLGDKRWTRVLEQLRALGHAV